MQIPNAQKPVTRVYSDFRGVDLTSAVTDVDEHRSPCMVNLYRDYDEFSGSLRTRPHLGGGVKIPGAERLKDAGEPYNNYWALTRRGSALVAMGKFLFYVPTYPEGLVALEGVDFTIYETQTVTMYPKTFSKDGQSVCMLTSGLLVPPQALGSLQTRYEPPVYAEYGDGIWFYTWEKVKIVETGGQVYVAETPDVADYYTNVVKIREDTLGKSVEDFLYYYVRQETLTAGFPTCKKEDENARTLQYPKYEDERDQETFAPVTFTGCSATGGGAANLPINLFSRHVRVDYDCLETPAVLTSGITVPADATNVSIRVYAPENTGDTWKYWYYDLNPYSGLDEAGNETRYRKWGSTELNNRIAKLPQSGDGRVHFIARVLARIRQPESVRGIGDTFRSCSTFDERVFFMQPDKRALRYSQAGNPCYLPDTALQYDSAGSGKPVCMLPFGGCLAVLPQDGEENCAVYLHTPQATSDDLLPKTYPSSYALTGLGAINASCAVSVNDKALFLSYDGLKQIVSTDIKKEASFAHRSSMVDGQLLPLLEVDGGKTARLFRYGEYACVYVLGHLFLANTNALYTNQNTKTDEFEWFVWENFRMRYQYASSKYSNMQPEHFYTDASGTLFVYFNTHYAQTDNGLYEMPVLHTFTEAGDCTDKIVSVCGDDVREHAVNVWSVMMTRFENFNAYLYKKDLCRVWQTAGVSGEEMDADVYSLTQPETFYFSYFCTEGNNSNPVVSFHKSAKKLKSAYIRLGDGKMRYILRDKGVDECAVAFVFKKPVQFRFATMQANIKGVAKR